MGTERTRDRTVRRNEIARRMLEEPEPMDRSAYAKIADSHGCSLRTVYRDVDWVTKQFRRGWVPPPAAEDLLRVSSDTSGESVGSVSRFPDHRLAIEDSLIEGRWSTREAQRIDTTYEVGGVRKVLRDAESVKDSVRSDLDADGVRLSVSVQLKRLHRTVSRHSHLQNDDLALKAEAELAKLHRGVIPLLGKMDGSEEMSPEERDFYKRLLGSSSGES